jgi:hypothetical protein
MKSRNSTVAFVALGLIVGAGTFGTSSMLVSQAMAAPAVSFSSEADMKKLIGTNIKNTAGDTVGEVKSVVVDKSGKIQDVIVSVGGFLGVGDREVALAWNDLTVTDEGKHVTTAMTKDTLKSLPEYKYKQASYRGTVFRD